MVLKFVLYIDLHTMVPDWCPACFSENIVWVYVRRVHRYSNVLFEYLWKFFMPLFLIRQHDTHLVRAATVYSYGNIVTGYGAQLIRNIKLTSDSFEGMPKNLPDSIKISCQIVHICSGCVSQVMEPDRRHMQLLQVLLEFS